MQYLKREQPDPQSHPRKVVARLSMSRMSMPAPLAVSQSEAVSGPPPHAAWRGVAPDAITIRKRLACTLTHNSPCDKGKWATINGATIHPPLPPTSRSCR